MLFLLLSFVVKRADGLVSARNQELAQTYANLQAAEALRDDMTDMIIHDLRTPLTSMRLSLELLGKVMEDPTKQQMRTRFWDNTAAAVLRMLELVNQILDVTKLEAGQLSLAVTDFPLNELLEEKVTFYSPQAERDGKQIMNRGDAGLLPVFADRDLISRVLDNLIGNALKYTNVGGQVVLHAENNSGGTLIQVRDDGEGMSPSDSAHVFDKFYQVTNDKGRPLRHGSGLGLTFCKTVIEAHDGQIWVASQVGIGSTFFIQLPDR